MNSGSGGFDSHALPPPCPPGTRLQHDDIVIRQVERTDERAVLEAWHAAFARLDPLARLDSATWIRRWFGNALGTHAQAAFASDGTCLAHFGGLPLRIRLRGEREASRRAWLVVDSFARVEARGGLGKKGLLARCCERFIAQSMSAERLDWAHGFPVPRAWELGRRVMAYEFDDEVRLWSAPLDRLEAWATPLEARAAVLDERIERLDLAAHPHAARVVRTRAHLAWRLGNDTSACMVLGTGGELRGFGAWRATPLLGEQQLALCEWIVPAHDADAQAALFAAALAHARAAGARRMAVLGSPRDPHAPLWCRLGFVLETLENVHACFVPGAPAEARRLAAELHLSLWDTDLA